MRMEKALRPDQPFFLYLAPGATHAPLHAPKEWIDKFKGKFDQGWNKVSEQTFERMKEMKIIPENAKYNPIPKEVGEWDKLTADQKKVYARMMEVYAAYLAFADYETGRLLQAVKDMGISENTLIIYGVGDNGGSAESRAMSGERLATWRERCKPLRFLGMTRPVSPPAQNKTPRSRRYRGASLIKQRVAGTGFEPATSRL